MATLKAFTMPKWGIEMAEGTIAEWGVAEGEPFTRGTVLALVETDKITNEIEAEADGRFVRLIAAAGETHPVGALLAVLSDGGEASEDEIASIIANFKQADTSFGDEPVIAASPPVAAPLPTKPIPDGLAISPAARATAEAHGIDVTALPGSGRKGRITAQDVDQATKAEARPNLRGAYTATPMTTAFATPLARRLGHLHGVDLATLSGSGPKGRIRKADVMAAVTSVNPVATAPRGAPPPTPSGTVEVMPMSAMRRTIARRLTEAKQTIPHFYLRRRVRTDRLAALRSAIEGQRPTIELSWEPDVEARVAGYRVYRRELSADRSGDWVRIGLVTMAAYRDLTVVAGHRYAYRVTAVSTAGNESGPSGEAVETAPR